MKLIILDRDGVINADSDAYIKSPDEWRLIPRSAQAIALLNAHGYTAAVATNQSGIARGMFDRNVLEAIHDKMRRQLADAGAHIDYIVYCPHGPEDACDCRKPKPGLLLQIAEHFHVSLRGVPAIGDALRDLQAAQQAGAAPVLVRTGKGERALAKGVPAGVPVYADLFEAVQSLLQR